MMRAYERLLKYAAVHTASTEDIDTTPTTARQFDLAHLLADELRALGMAEVYEDEHAYVYAALPASAGMEGERAIGLIAHIDTVPDFSGENVRPQVIENYDGGEVPLGTSGRVLSPEKFAELPALKGQTLITTDGTTVLGADDKAGVAEIMTACERIIAQGIPHGRIAVCFTPDEEVGHGAALLDFDRLRADFAYTVDGGALEEVNFETFNAAAAHWDITGFNIHPGDAKNTMINASLVACEINAMLPAGDTPAHTEGYEGFYHLMSMTGTVERAELDYIVRDHSAASFAAREATLQHIEKLINEKYGAGTAKLTLTEQYPNMAECMSDHMDIVERAERAIAAAGLKPVRVPVRGGTDGAQLSFRGLPCPNLGTGGHSFHGPYEHITAEAMDTAVEIILGIVGKR